MIFFASLVLCFYIVLGVSVLHDNNIPKMQYAIVWGLLIIHQILDVLRAINHA